MPRVVVPVPETRETISRPVITEVVRQIISLTGMPANTAIVYPGEIDKKPQAGSTINKNAEKITLTGDNRITIDVEENHEINRLISTAVNQAENIFIFRDDRVDTYIKPVYSSTEVTINFRFRSVDKIGATRWRDDIRTRLAMGREVNLHSFSYGYLLPPELILILKEIHRLRENVAGYGEDFLTFFKNNSTQRLTEITNVSGTQKAWTIAETQGRVVGLFDFEGIPEQGNRDDEVGTWTISFSYKFKYDKPIHCAMFYPTMVHGQLLGLNFLPEPTEYPDKYSSKRPLSSKNLKYFELGSDMNLVHQGYFIPRYDDFNPTYTQPDTLRLVTAAVTRDAIYPSFLFSLRELVEVELDPEILTFMVGETAYMVKAYHSIFALSIYANQSIMEPKSLMVDSDLDVHATFVMNPRINYHVRLAIYTDLSKLTVDALLRLRKNASVLIKILKALDPTLEANGQLPKILGNNYITKAELDKVIAILNRGIIAKGDGQVYQFNTVQTMFVTAS